MDMDCLKPIAEGDTQELLKQAAKVELLLYVALHPFTAKLQAHNWAKEPKQAEEWRNNSGELVPLNPVAAKTLTMFTEANLTWFEPEGSWEEGNHYHDHVWFLDKPQTVTREQVYFESSGSTEGLDVFKTMEQLSARAVTVRLLRKDEYSQPDRVEISALGVKRTVFCTDLGLIDKRNGTLNRAGSMLLALSKSTPALNIKAPEQAMKELRKIFRDIGITEKDPFHPKATNWKPRFKLMDAIKQADQRLADRATHVPYDDDLQYKQEGDAAGEFLAEHDNNLPS